MGDEQELVPCEEVGQKGVLAAAFDNLVNRVVDSLKAGKLLDTLDQSGS